MKEYEAYIRLIDTEDRLEGLKLSKKNERLITEGSSKKGEWS